MITYPYSDPDPVARPGRVYPYFRFDVFTSNPVTHEWKMVELENDFIRLAITPEIGGKVWEAYEKSGEFPIIFSGHSVKFRDVALRGAWTSGGLEFNFGDIGHATTTSTPVDYYTRTNVDGSVSCFIGATEWASRTTWRVEIRLAPDKAYFTTRSWWYNNTPVEQELYHWINAGFRAPGNLEFIFPGSHYIGHQGEYDTWPLDSVGRKISFYDHNNFGGYKSFHVLGRPTNFYGGYWHMYDMGFGHYTPYYEKLGKKAWSWGLSREGLLWERLLTDTDGPNVELQSGRLFNQASPGSELTPFKHVGFAPYSADTWTDHWFPVKHTRGLTNASPRGALNLRADGKWLKIDWMSLEYQSDSIVVSASGSPILSRQLKLNPMELYRDSVLWQGNMEKVKVELGKDVLTDDPGQPLNRPLDAPDNFDWNSAYGLLLHGTDLSRQKNYKDAEVYLLKALQMDPNLLPALTQMSQIRFRQGLYDEARDYAGKALAVNTYDGEANYFWGLSAVQTGHDTDALDGFSVAVLSPAFRHAAWLRIAYLAINRKDWNEADNVIHKCVNAYPPDEHACTVKAMIKRKQGDPAAAMKLLGEQLLIDPLNHFARFEKYLNSGLESDKNEFTRLIRQELPHETYIEMAIMYHEWNMETEALRILELSPVHPMVQLWQAYLMHRMGQKAIAAVKLESSLAASPELVFPFRPEMIRLLSWADQVKPGWKWKYYEALVRWQHNQPEKAKALFNRCGMEPDFMAFYLAKANLYRDDPSTVKTSLERAYMLNPDSWRTSREMVKIYVQEQQLGKALVLANRNFKNNPDNCVVGLQYAHVLRLNGRYRDALNTLSQIEMLPAEMDKWSGEMDGQSLFRETNVLLALDNIKTGKLKTAITYLNESETWPEHLGSGEPYFPDNRLTQLIIAYCLDRLGDKPGMNKSLNYIMIFRDPDGPSGQLGNSIAGVLKRGVRDFKTITEQVLGEDIKNRDVEILKEFLKVL